MIKLLNTEDTYKAKMYATDNAYDVKRYLIGREEDTRLLYDASIKTWYIASAAEYIHMNFVEEGWKNGLYAEFDYKTKEELWVKHCTEHEFIYMYFYTDKPVQPNKTGDYGVHYYYDFGILDSNDILKKTKIKFEDTELYKILEKNLVKTEIEERR